ncbi:YceI family protein [Pseudobacteriovorax antillogorgiicola]|uniref:Polyisoprenoid-binding protein YceI n=1 Tax=Pseudobacteriovorax antillogorgiicola TaxID=1513793 RepID=A0A1Y6B9A2_9BACT|nr:YceI family protein [Pseudobacteriovorax antillogorgiicola]TCS58507.1 polyisoprenoid-binding protein YceI [Pseudobacteriovorax antillogorgiicola]SME98151.1 Polyisoprenoid-binding protein YceI [Pseudobacteriovorax antillogorgiicola]
MKKIFLSLASSALLLSSSALAGNMDINKAQSKIEWMGKKVIGDSHNGTIDVKSGHLKVDSGKLTGGEIVVNMKSIKNEDVKDPKWNKKLVGHLESADFFATEKHPESKLIITSAKSTGKNKYELQGKLTVRGITKDINKKNSKDSKEVEVKIENVMFDGNKLVATMTFDRTVFDVKYGSSSIFKLAADKVIDDKIKIDATIYTTPANKQSSL